MTGFDSPGQPHTHAQGRVEGCEFGTYMVCTSEMGEYAGFCDCPRGRWLPTKLAEWIGENLQEELGFPDKADKRAEPGTGWTPADSVQNPTIS